LRFWLGKTADRFWEPLCKRSSNAQITKFMRPSVAICCCFSGRFGRLDLFNRCLRYLLVLPDRFGRSSGAFCICLARLEILPTAQAER
jgi:hypothetical protein